MSSKGPNSRSSGGYKHPRPSRPGNWQGLNHERLRDQIRKLQEQGVLPRGGELSESAQHGDRALTLEGLVQTVLEHELTTVSRIGLTQTLAYQMTLEAVACIRAHIRLGNLRAAVWWGERMLGDGAGIEESFGEQVQRLDLKATAERLTELLDGMDLPPAVVELFTERVLAASVQEQPARSDPDGEPLAPVFTQPAPADLPDPDDYTLEPPDEDEQIVAFAVHLDEGNEPGF